MMERLPPDSNRPEFYFDPNVHFSLFLLGMKDPDGEEVTVMGCYFCLRSANRLAFLGLDPDDTMLLVCENCLKTALSVFGERT